MNNIPTIDQLFDLAGKRALITGGSGYLGAAMASALAEAGASVIVGGRDAQRAAQAAATLPVVGTAQHSGVQLDHMESAQLSDAFHAVVARCGEFDILINNAHEPLGADLSNCSGAEFTRQLSNATGYFLLARLIHDRAVARALPASIIMLGSMYGLVGSYPDAYEPGSANPVAYQTLKGGILQMVRHLAVYWAPHRVRVNALSPGPFPDAASVPADLVTRLTGKVPLRRMGQPYELKGAIVFLASDASSYVTGHNLVVDGGWTAW